MKKILLVMFLCLVFISYSSALEIDNIIIYDEAEDTITFKNAFGFGKDLAKATLIENICDPGIYGYRRCHANKNITLYENGELIQDFKTLRIDDDSWQQEDIISHDFKYYDGESWVEFMPGQIFESGTYQVVTSGLIYSNRAYDWQVKINGDWTTPWATWGNISLGDQAEVILNSPANDTDFLVNNISFSCSANVTGGDNLTAINLYSNFSGTFELNETRNLTNSWRVDAFNFSNDLNITANMASLGRNLFFKIDGTRMFIIDAFTIDQYECSEAWNLSTCVFNLTGAISTAFSMYFLNDGLTLYATTIGIIRQYSCSSAWEIDTCSQVNSLDTSEQVVFSKGIYFREDGNRMFNLGQDNETVYQYSCSTSFNISTCSTTNNLNVSLQDSTPTGLSFNIDGKNMFIIGGDTGSIHEYSCSTAWNVSTCINTSILNLSDITTTPVGLYFRQDGLKFFFQNFALDSFVFEYDTVLTNITFSTQIFNKTLLGGAYLWTCQGADTSGATGFATENRTLTVDATIPQITIINPVGDEGINIVGGSQNLNWSVNDTASNLDSCWFDYNGTNVTVTCSDNSTTFILEENNLNLTFYANDTAGNENSEFTEWFYTFFEASVTFNDTAFETSTQFFILNMTTLSDILTVDAILNYNGTRFTTTSECVTGSCSISTSIDIPLVTSGENENKSFFWEITGFNATSSFSVNSSVRQQNVTRIHLEQCNATFTNQTLNFTAFDEITLASVDPFSFNADFEFWLGSGTIIRNISFAEPTISSFQLCILPADVTYNINGVVEYDEAVGTNYTIRNYYFQNDQIDSNSQDIGLGLLLADQSTTFILKVQDADILPLANVLIFTERFYAGTGEFLVVQVAKTDDNGKSVGFFEAETGDYRFIIKQNGVTLLITPSGNRSQKVVGEEVPFTLTFTVGEDEGPSWEDFEPVDDLISTLIFNTTTQVLSFTYSDTSADFTSSLLQVFKVNATADDSLICNSNLSQSAGIITCNMTGNVTGNYIAKGIIFRGSVRILAEQIIFTIENFTTQAGRLGLFLGWIVILITSLAFKFNEIAGIMLTNIAMIFVNLIGLLNFGITWITAWVGISIIILVMLER